MHDEVPIQLKEKFISQEFQNQLLCESCFLYLEIKFKLHEEKKKGRKKEEKVMKKKTSLLLHYFFLYVCAFVSCQIDP